MLIFRLTGTTYYIWAAVCIGQLSETDDRKLMARIERSTLDYDFFPVDEATDDLGDFAISPDGTTFYLTVPNTGEIIVWQPTPNQPPVCDFDAQPPQYIGPPPASITFDAVGSYDPDGEIIDYHWDFGDETTGSGQSVVHEYNETGLYTVTLTVTDNEGGVTFCTDTVDILIT